MIPRIQGKVGELFEDEKSVGWGFEMWLSFIGDGEGKSLGVFGPWKTEQEAHLELKRASELSVREVAMNTEGADPSKYVDLLTNKTCDM